MKWSPLAGRLHYRLTRNGLLKKKDRLLLALSGGMDSVVLLHLMLELQPVWEWELIAGHVNHGLRPGEDKTESRFCCELAGKYGLPYLEASLRLREEDGVKHVSEEFARRRRYEIFESWIKKTQADALLTGHHAGDQAETILYRMLTGSGLHGLRGIPARRAAYRRPLLDFSRRELEHYAKERNVPYMNDASNTDERYVRNRIRMRILPFLQKNGIPNAEKQLAKSARDLGSAEAALQYYTDSLFENTLTTEGAVIRLRHDIFHSAPVYVRHGMLKKLMRQLTGIRVGRRHLEQLSRFIALAETGRDMQIGGIRILKERQSTIFGYRDDTTPKKHLFPCSPGTTIASPLPGPFSITLLPAKQKNEYREAKHALFSTEILDRELCLRPWESGDRMRLFGSGGHKKVSDILKDEKIPASLKRSYPVLLLDHDILWIPGVKRSALFRVEDRDEHMILITCQYKRRQA
jgi:tRNA(Ile)-lysidine synthase